MLLGVLDRKLSFDNLSFEGAGRAPNAKVADQLLGDRRSTLDRLARFEVFDSGAQDALRVDRPMLVKALILDRNRRQLEVFGDPSDRHRLIGRFGIDYPELAAISGVKRRVAASIDRFTGGQRGGLGGNG